MDNREASVSNRSKFIHSNEVCLKSVCVWKSAGITITNVFDSGERVEMRLRLLHALGLPQLRLVLYCDTGLT